MVHRSENQFVYLNPKGSKLIFFTPLPDDKAGFRVGVMKKIRKQSWFLKK